MVWKISKIIKPFCFWKRRVNWYPLFGLNLFLVFKLVEITQGVREQVLRVYGLSSFMSYRFLTFLESLFLVKEVCFHTFCCLPLCIYIPLFPVSFLVFLCAHKDSLMLSQVRKYTCLSAQCYFYITHINFASLLTEERELLMILSALWITYI